MVKPQVLCIDDDPRIVDSLNRLLELNGFLVISSSIESASVELIALSEPDVILLDISMPTVNGLDILKELQNGYSDIPVVIVSGRDDPATKAEAKRLGAADFVAKPFDPQDLLFRIRTIHKGLHHEKE